MRLLALTLLSCVSASALRAEPTPYFRVPKGALSTPSAGTTQPSGPTAPGSTGNDAGPTDPAAQPPVVAARSYRVTQGASAPLDPAVASGGAAPYTYEATGLPAGITLASDGTLGGSAQTPGDYAFTVVATDARNVRSAPAAMSMTVLPGLSRIGFQTGTITGVIGNAVRIQPTATPASGGTFTLDAGPSFAVIDPTTGLVTAAARTSDMNAPAGSPTRVEFTVTVGGTDGYGRPMTPATSPLVRLGTGQVSYVISGSVVEGAELGDFLHFTSTLENATFSKPANGGGWYTVMPDGRVSGIVPNIKDVPGSSTTQVPVQVSATNGLATIELQRYISVNSAYVLMDSYNLFLEWGGTGTMKVSATNMPSPTYSLVGAPTWVSVDPSTGTVTASPPADTAGSFTFQLRASHGPAKVDRTLVVESGSPS